MPCSTRPTDGFKGCLKKRSQRLFHLSCDKATWKIPAVDTSGILFQTTCNAWIRCNLLPPLWGRVGERAPPEWRQSFPNSLIAQIQTLRLVALSLTLSYGREDGRLLGLRFAARKTGCAGYFLFFRRPEINGCKPKLPFKLPEIAKSTATRSLPRGGGLGRGHSSNGGNLHQHPNHPNTSLAACCPLSNSLPRERGRGGCWD